jgi:hypothetical protein
MRRFVGGVTLQNTSDERDLPQFSTFIRLQADSIFQKAIVSVIKAWPAETFPALQHHLGMAETLEEERKIDDSLATVPIIWRHRVIGIKIILTPLFATSRYSAVSDLDP